MTLNNNEVIQYLEDGVVVIRNVISRYWLNELSIGVEKNFKNPSKYKCVYEKKDSKELFFDDYCNWQKIKEYKNFFYNSKFEINFFKTNCTSNKLAIPFKILSKINFLQEYCTFNIFAVLQKKK